MIKNFIKIAIRTLLRHKVNSMINIIGLMVGFSSSILIMNYVYFELSYDNFHKKGDRIYRIAGEGSMPGGKAISISASSGEIPQAVLQQVPEIEKASRVYGWDTEEVTFADKRFISETLVWVDTSFFGIFDFPFLEGNPDIALRDPFTVVLTRKTAQKFFGDTALNQMLNIDGNPYKVTGIIANIPPNSHLKSDMFASFSSVERPEYNVVKSNGISFPQYYLFREGVDPAAVKKKVIGIANNSIDERLGNYGIRMDHSLQPLHRIHLYSDFSFDTSDQGDINKVYIFIALAVFIILIAVMNFINLVTAQSDSRAREISMRKVCGATRRNIVWQFTGESVILALISFSLALVLNELLISPLASTLDTDMSIVYWNNPWIFLSMVFFAVFTGAISGIYPALYLSRFQPVRVLKGIRHSGKDPHFLRKVLVTMQMSISVFLITSILLIQAQMGYIQQKDPGFNKENVLVFHNLTGKIRNSYKSLKGEMKNLPYVVEVTASQSVPGYDRSVQNLYNEGDDPKSGMIVYENRVQHGYIETMGLHIIKGRDFNPEMATDTGVFILNEIAVKKLGLKNPIGKKVVVWEQSGKVAGVVKDFNFRSFHHEVDPHVFTMYSHNFNRISVRIKPGAANQAVEKLSRIMQEADPFYIADYYFLDQSLERHYRKERQVNHLITSAAILAMLLSMLGLYGLATFTIRKKMKEIAIRKTLGGSPADILMLLFRDLLRWVLIGTLLAWPVAYIFISTWLENFAFRIHIGNYWWIFPAAFVIVLLISILAMLYQTLKATRTNPAEVLTYE